jgi:ketosteroid isomerase-like protein
MRTATPAAGHPNPARFKGALAVTTASTTVTTTLLENFTAAFNRHDVDRLLAMMTDDCVFEGAAGPEAYGIRFSGAEAVGAAFAQVWATFPDAHWGRGRHFVHGDFGVSEWTFTGTRADGARIEAEGCDLFSFRDGKIALKRDFRKDRPLLAAGK